MAVLRPKSRPAPFQAGPPTTGAVGGKGNSNSQSQQNNNNNNNNDSGVVNPNSFMSTQSGAAARARS